MGAGPAEAEPDGGIDPGGEAETGSDASNPHDDPSETRKTLSERLVADLTAHRTAALRDALAEQPQVAFLVALQTSLDKASMAAKAEDLLSGTGWLPPLLRRSGAAPE